VFGVVVFGVVVSVESPPPPQAENSRIDNVNIDIFIRLLIINS
jgi:hypothetical protein